MNARRVAKSGSLVPHGPPCRPMAEPALEGQAVPQLSVLAAKPSFATEKTENAPEQQEMQND